jgi:hypothetical protein
MKKERPWMLTLIYVKTRCYKHRSYGKRGVKNFLTCEDVKSLWYRDGAGFMNHPSIDRIDTGGDYTLENCRFIELINNKRRPRREGFIVWNKGKKIGPNSRTLNKLHKALTIGEEGK